MNVYTRPEDRQDIQIDRHEQPEHDVIIGLFVMN